MPEKIWPIGMKRVEHIVRQYGIAELRSRLAYALWELRQVKRENAALAAALVRDSATPPGNAGGFIARAYDTIVADPAWAAWQAEVAAWDALADEAAAKIDAADHDDE